MLAAFVAVTFEKAGLYRPRLTVLNLLELRSVVRMAFIAGAMFLAVVMVGELFPGRHWVLALAAAATLPTLLAERRAMAALRAKGHWLNGDGERTLVYGYNEAARLLMKKIVQAPEAGRQLVGFVDDFVMDGTEVTFRVDRNGSAPFVARLLGPDGRIWPRSFDGTTSRKYSSARLSSSRKHWRGSATKTAGALGIRWGIAAQFGNARPDELAAEDVGAIPILYPVVPPRRQWSYLIPNACLTLSWLSWGLRRHGPCGYSLPLAIWVESGSPVLFRQERVGKDGRRFVMLKFRSLPREISDPYHSSTTLPLIE